MKRLAPAFALFGLLTVNFSVCSAEPLGVSEAYVRQVPANVPAAAFMQLQNSGRTPLRIVRAESPAARVTELHNHINDHGVMRMRQIPAIDIPAGGRVALQPGGLHIMLIDLVAPLNEGDIVPVTLTLEDGATQQLRLPVKRIEPGRHMPAQGHMPHGQMPHGRH